MKEIRDIIDWLIKLEDLANKLYTDCAEYFKDDVTLRDFLLKAANDEVLHYNTVKAAAAHLDQLQLRSIAIDLDTEAREKLEAPLNTGFDLLENKKLTKEELFDIIGKIELTEWNDIFIYIVNQFKNQFSDFKDIAINMQNHKRYIEKFLHERSGGSQDLETLNSLTPVWKEKILIVEDDPEIIDLLIAILQDEGEVFTAENGREALDLLEKEYFKVILSDINMPVMNGIEFFENTKKKNPEINSRFIFFTGNPTEENRSFLKKHKLDFILKPAPVTEIRTKVQKLLNRE
ncbi:MAG: response regulator [bacterium]|nr:response regulator [bacterium]